MIAVMILLALAVVATAVGVLYWFFIRLGRIEEEHWGTKRQEAVDTALAEAEAEAANTNDIPS